MDRVSLFSWFGQSLSRNSQDLTFQFFGVRNHASYDIWCLDLWHLIPLVY
jgi:hypothetical protein